MTDRQGGSSQNEAAVFDPQKSSEPPKVRCHVVLNTRYDVELIVGQLEQTVGQERVWSQIFEKCAAVASPSGSLEIYFMVITSLFVIWERLCILI